MSAHRQLARYRSVPLSAVVAVLVLCASSVSGQAVAPLPPSKTSAVVDRAPGVPADFVITPFGYFHPSCVRKLAEQDLLLADGRVQHANGAVEAQSAACAYPHYTATGFLVPGDLAVPLEANLALAGLPAINGWLEDINVQTSTSYTKISATWPVPPAPSTNEGQSLFFFPGFEDYIDNLSIVQPVLQFGSSAAGGGNYWTIGSWNCCMSGVTWYSHLVKVKSGDTVLGTITPTCKKSPQSCATWKIVTEDQTTGKKTVLNKSSAQGQVWNWAFGAVAEVYSVRQCSDFPANTSLTLTVQLYDQNGVMISDPGWVGRPAAAGLTPACNYGLNVTATQETLEY
jgi:hypothetical protein